MRILKYFKKIFENNCPQMNRVSDLFNNIDNYTEDVILKSLKKIELPIKIENILNYYGFKIYKNLNLCHFSKNVDAYLNITEKTKDVFLNSNNIDIETERYILAYSLGLLIVSNYINKEFNVFIEPKISSRFGKDINFIFAHKFAKSILIPKKAMEIAKYNVIENFVSEKNLNNFNFLELQKMFLVDKNILRKELLCHQKM